MHPNCPKWSNLLHLKYGIGKCCFVPLFYTLTFTGSSVSWSPSAGPVTTKLHLALPHICITCSCTCTPTSPCCPCPLNCKWSTFYLNLSVKYQFQMSSMPTHTHCHRVLFQYMFQYMACFHYRACSALLYLYCRCLSMLPNCPKLSIPPQLKIIILVGD